MCRVMNRGDTLCLLKCCHGLVHLLRAKGMDNLNGNEVGMAKDSMCRGQQCAGPSFAVRSQN